MSKAININAGLMLLISILFAYFTANYIAANENQPAYGWGFIFGQALASVLFPLLLVWFVRKTFRLKPIFTKGAFVCWWVLFLLLGIQLPGGMFVPNV